MYKILHFDHRNDLNPPIISTFRRAFKENSDISYEYFDNKKKAFENHIQEIEKKLQDANMFIVHPGYSQQKIVTNLLRNVSDLETIFLTSGDLSGYDFSSEYTILGYTQQEEIIAQIMKKVSETPFLKNLRNDDV